MHNICCRTTPLSDQPMDLPQILLGSTVLYRLGSKWLSFMSSSFVKAIPDYTKARVLPLQYILAPRAHESTEAHMACKFKYLVLYVYVCLPVSHIVCLNLQSYSIL